MPNDRDALFDMDGTIADYNSAMKSGLANLGFNFRGSLYKAELRNPNLLEAKRLISRQKGWWLNLKPIDSGLEIIKLCRDLGFKINILTQIPRDYPQAATEKIEWCQKYVAPIVSDFGVFTVCGTGRKGAVYGRVLVDDFVPYMKNWLENRPRGLGLMPINFDNRQFTHGRVEKYFQRPNWKTDELVEKLKRAYSRRSGREGY